MQDDYGNPFTYRLKWLYLLLIVAALMSPVFYVMYISFNENGFGAAKYVFTLEWYKIIFTDKLLINALKWTMTLAVVTMIITVPMAVLAAKFYKQTTYKVFTVFLLLSPLFVASDILGSSLLVFFKNMNGYCVALAERFGWTWLSGWFELGFITALIGLIIYTIPYAFIVVLITMGRYKEEQTEAARACGASGWRAFWDIEFPQIDTFTTVLVSQMLNVGMSETSYAMSSVVSYVAILIIGTIVLYTMYRSESLQRQQRLSAEPVNLS